MDITSLVGLVPPLYELCKETAKLVSKKKDPEISNAVEKWQQAQLEFLSRFTEFQVDYTQIHEELRKLKNWEATKETLKFRDNMYWKEGDDSPYCSACADGKNKLIHLHEWRNKGGYECPDCKSKIQTKDEPIISAHVQRREHWTDRFFKP
ncbi:MAG TPA: hypothetical protein PLI53_00405 [Geobacteraceae bacterium]|jgi:DNA-directed RNA polymerase subunit RPC12/RpoP|nr:hypothetical protein [Geobacteraceae bacterium]